MRRFKMRWEVRKLYEEGLKPNEIAMRLGIARPLVYYYLKSDVGKAALRRWPDIMT